MSKVIWTTCIHINEFGIANINIILLIRVTILCHLVTVGGRFGRGSCLKSSARLGLMSKVPLFLRCGGSFNRSSMPTEKSIEQASNKHFGRELDRTLSMIELKKNEFNKLCDLYEIKNKSVQNNIQSSSYLDNFNH